MKVLLTGGLGYIGCHIAVELLQQGHDVVIFDNLSNSHLTVLERIKAITQKKVVFIRGDLRSLSDIRKTFESSQIEAVIHLAALKSVSESVRHPLEYYINNVVGSLNLIQAMSQANIKRLIFSSSATVYGQPEHLPITEQASVGKVTNPYGQTKLIIEKILADICLADPEWQITSLRYFNPIGAHPSGMIGEDPRGMPNNILPYITQVAIRRRPYFTILGDDYPTKDGTGVRDYIHVQDLALGHIAALMNAKNKSYQVYNLGTGKGYSVLDIINSFKEINNIDIPFIIEKRRPGDIAECWSSPELAKRELGWQAKFELKDMLRDSWNWQQKNPFGYGN
ncbi:UDP-glucose 4-epimerase GalE [Escherichia coli]|uniref:UDP-glucose 4-epimerase GalE n=1 Tax=Escherichia coli TaxID=562 RepID=UPI0011DDFDAC|nr:UDP-glucose 4-epimerase GalE [Escherichia coli]EKK2196314.1 UDP-glucose 4-epimerase GalE [Escherichia coli]NEV40017.1 UDP-glucose 4-epimerase GalE [Escherichia coli]TXX23350.1 UDP-glucose 4-epimerase GalE [Escherichia coli]HBA8984366.1 UDP-glucose 4-epimerase GalE [Escherichia coli]HBA9025190.1 UDP-glucose 4-epimerase GalE [Escherichia coli]